MEAVKEKLKGFWSKPNNRNLVIALPVLLILYLIISGVKDKGSDNKRRAAEREEVVESIQVFDTGDMEQLDRYQVEAMRDEMEAESIQNSKLLANDRKAMREENRELSELVINSRKEMQEMKKQLNAFIRNGGLIQQQQSPIRNKGTRTQSRNQPAQSVVQQAVPSSVDVNTLNRQQTTILTRNAPIEGRAIRRVTQRQIRSVNSSGNVQLEDNPNAVLSQRTKENRRKSTARMKEQETLLAKELFLPAGSIISGTLLNGVDAPTSTASANDPMPILLRIKKEAILPNNFTMDVRECHLLASAVGELSSERVRMRAEALSCVLNDGRAIEKNITAYAVSSYDGKVGIRGRLVSRNGSAIARAMMAGFMSGIADAAQPQKIVGVNTSNASESIWQASNPGDIVTSGAFNGASKAMDRLAEYYTEMAENMYPIIELSAGTQVDFIVQKGMSFKLQESSNPSQNQPPSSIAR